MSLDVSVTLRTPAPVVDADPEPVLLATPTPRWQLTLPPDTAENLAIVLRGVAAFLGLVALSTNFLHTNVPTRHLVVTVLWLLGAATALLIVAALVGRMAEADADA
jgi:hypothetical protein